MFNLFKKPPKTPKVRMTASGREPTKAATVAPTTVPVPLQEVPLPEVQEGNDVTDWALWEDSVVAMDSQMQSLTPSATIYMRVKERPSEFQDIDAFSSIGKNSP